MRDGQVRLSRKVPGFAFVENLGECGDARCGCYRLHRPDIREHFRELTTKLVAEAAGDETAQRGGSGLRYVTVGSGHLLTDFELLCALVDTGLRIGSIICIDTCYADGDAGQKSAFSALTQLGTFFAPTPVYAFASLQRFSDACKLEPHIYGRASAYIHCDAGAVDEAESRRAAAQCLIDGGVMVQLSNLGCGGPGKDVVKGADQHSGVEDEAHSFDQRMRKYWECQLRDSYEIKAWRRTAIARAYGSLAQRADLLLDALPASQLRADPEAAAARKALATRWLSQSRRERAEQFGLSLWSVVFAGSATHKDGKEIPSSLRHTVAVRDKPSREARMISTRKRGDQILAAAECDGWVRLSEEDDDWGWQKAMVSSNSEMKAEEAWMLIDATSLGLGKLLHKEADYGGHGAKSH